MSLKTTIVLLVIAGALVGLWAAFLRDDPTTVPAAGSSALFPDLVAAGVRKIEIEDGSGERLSAPVTLAPQGDGSWSLSTVVIDQGHPVRARSDAVAAVLEAVRALSAISRLAPDAPEDRLEGYGLSERRRARIRVERDGAPEIVADFGAPHGAGTTVFRKGGDPTVWLIPREARNVAIPTLDQLEDTALVSIPFLDVQRLVIERPDGFAVELERQFDRWWLVRPVRVLADDRKADELRNSILDVRVLKRLRGDDAAKVQMDPPEWRVAISVRGRPEPVRLTVGKATAEGVPVRIGDEPAVRLVHSAFQQVLEASKGSLRDPRLIGFPTAEIQNVRVTRSDGSVLDLDRINKDDFQMRFPPRGGVEVPPRNLDAVAKAEFLDRLTSLAFKSYGAGAPGFTPAVKVEIVRGAIGGAGAGSMTVTFGAEVRDGAIRASVSGEEGSGWVDSVSTAFLDAPFWTLLAPEFYVTTAYWELAHVRIEDNEGRSVELRGHIAGEGADIAFTVGEGAAKRDVAPEVATGVSRRSIPFTFQHYAGEDPAPEMGFDKPTLKVTWGLARDARSSGIPENPDLAPRVLRVGAKRADGLYFARFDDPLGLVFLVKKVDLDAFYSVLQGYAR